MIIDSILELGVEERLNTLHPEIREKVANSGTVTRLLEDLIKPLFEQLKENKVGGLQLGSEGITGTDAAARIHALKIYINNTWVFSIEFKHDLLLTFSARDKVHNLFPGYALFLSDPEIENKGDHFISPFSEELWDKFRVLLLNKKSLSTDMDKNSPILDIIENAMKTEAINSPLNQILFGPPGTGKTYHAIEAAVKAVDPDFYSALNIDERIGASNVQRTELSKKYAQLCSEGRIRFVTFHQSYGYEEFVEGLKAEATPDNQIAYKVSNGIFKSICDAALRSEPVFNSDINSAGKVWKLSIEGAHQNPAKTYCLENNIAAIGWGMTGDLSSPIRNDYFNAEGKNNQNSLNYFSQDMKEGDLVVCIDSKTSVEAVGVVAGPYRYVDGGLPTRGDYNHQLPVNWLAKGFSVDFKELNENTQFNLPTCYPLSRLSVSDVLTHLKAHGVNIERVQSESVGFHSQNYALIIDEINRGNISKIFGELITLIEPSKRRGAKEQLDVTLPYSGQSFSVPDNLFIIGTMNTADRSLAMMDTALRRRFDFKEMMPKPELFKNRKVKGIDLTRLLETLNRRIEVLYDREHTLGHAFFFPVYDEENEDQAFIELQQAFKNKIIPLLEEYFYEDWNKIRLVLGDSQKSEQHLRFLSKQEDLYADLFGSEHGLDLYEDKKVTYSVKPFAKGSVWDDPAAYIAMYKMSVSEPSES
ncbi:AAA family ATPase [Photobacterium sp. BZF1]|uniref:AAA family ATPase n=1 Tax=Photobacterium sp. BZF1 TaxID=1904457 RepID=UPI0021061DC8|nr:AAA family ATPase [Photobacterium sp. BZF1]